MGASQSTQQSRNLSPLPPSENENVMASTTTISESDDEFTDCSEDFEDLSADIKAKSDDEIVKNSKPLENSSKHNDDVARSQTKLAVGRKQIESDDDDESLEDRKERQRKDMEEFREEMNKKREMRHACIQKLREELTDLRGKLSTEMETNTQLRETLEFKGVNKSFDELVDENKKLKVELAECQMFLQTSNSENINRTLENQAFRDQVRSLKEVISAVKEMLTIRELQVDQMKSKLTEIEASMSERETKIMSTALQQEYQRQLENIRNMRELYEERANILAQERDALKQQLDDKEHDLKTEIEKSKNLEEYISTLENNVKLKNDDIGQLESDIGILKSEKAQVASEMSAVNQLIAEVLFGFNANYIDMDKLVNMLEQNRDLLNEMAIKENYEGIDEGYFLPKLLYDLFLQVNQAANEGEQAASSSVTNVVNSPEEIAEKLPKVWRVLIELLSHHKKLNDEEERVLDNCYKAVQTPTGTQNVLSVSKTFIKLKDLILEKRSLQKDTTRLKTLYSHLEQRLDKQEKRLSNVSLELTKTWHLVGKIKRQHRQLHTHEQILCYQLQQKRRLLNELKQELEYCRKKWALARTLNLESEEQCKQLRHEFSMRKVQDQNSAESGYSDEHPSDADADDDEAGPSKKAIKVEKIDDNLTKFDGTSSPTYTERRHSESPLNHDFPHLCLFSRAQSEPPRVLEIFDEGLELDQGEETETEQVAMEVFDSIPDQIYVRCVTIQEEETVQVTAPIYQVTAETVQVTSPIDHGESESFEILNLIPDPIYERCLAIDEPERCVASPAAEPNRRTSGLIVTPPPQVLVYNTPKLRAHLRLCKKQEGRRERARTNSETAEDMYLRLMGRNNSECNTCSSTSSIDEEDFDTENVEEIQEIPFDEVAVMTEECEISLEAVEGFACVVEAEAVAEVPNEPQPSTSQQDNESMLSQKEQEYLQRREARLTRLEAEAKEFYDKMTRNKDKGVQLNNHINDVHNTFLERNKERNKSEGEKTKDEPTTSDGETTDKKIDEPETEQKDEGEK